MIAIKPRHILTLLIGWWVLLCHNWRLALIVLAAVCGVVIAVCLIIRLMDTPLDEHYDTTPKHEPDEFDRLVNAQLAELKGMWPMREGIE